MGRCPCMGRCDVVRFNSSCPRKCLANCRHTARVCVCEREMLRSKGVGGVSEPSRSSRECSGGAHNIMIVEADCPEGVCNITSTHCALRASSETYWGAPSCPRECLESLGVQTTWCACPDGVGRLEGPVGSTLLDGGGQERALDGERAAHGDARGQAELLGAVALALAGAGHPIEKRSISALVLGVAGEVAKLGGWAAADRRAAAVAVAFVSNTAGRENRVAGTVETQRNAEKESCCALCCEPGGAGALLLRTVKLHPA